MGKNIHPFQPITLTMVLRYTLCSLLMIAPFARGLFFEAYSMPFFLVVALLFILFIYEQVHRKEQGFFNYPLDWAILALLLAYIISLISAVNIRSDVVSIMKYAAYVMIFWMCFRTVRSQIGYDTLTYSIYIAGVGIAVVALLIYCGVINYPYAAQMDRVSGTLEYPNTLGIYVAVISMLGWGLILSSRNWLIRVVLAGGNAVLLMTMLGSVSRGAWVLYPFAILAFILLIDRGKKLSALTTWLVSIIPAMLMGRWFMTGTPSARNAIFISGAIILAMGIQAVIDYLTRYLRKHNLVPHQRLLGILLSGILVITLAGAIASPAVRGIIAQGSLSRLTDITLQDKNVQERMEFNHDALKIVKDHPVIGVGAEGWQSLYHRYASRLYWTSKSHNYFLQTWVETGTVGFIALMAVWITLVYTLWKYRKRSGDEAWPIADASFWGATVACFYLGAHSLIDFDMSYPAVAFLLFGLMGMLQGRAQRPSMVIEAVKGKSGSKQRELLSRWRREAYTALSVGGLAVLLLAFTACSFWFASNNYARAQELYKNNPNQALACLENAVGYDSLNGSYWAAAGGLMAFSAVSAHNATMYNQGLRYCDKAIQLSPYDLKILNAINQTYLQLGEYDRAVELAQKIIAVNPLDPSCYENFANSQVLAGLYYMEKGQPEKARSSWDTVLKVESMIPSKMNELPAGLSYTSGQALLLLGEREQGEDQLQTMLKATGADNNGQIAPDRQKQIQNYQLQSRAWLAASLEVSADQANAQKILDPVPDANKTDINNQVQKIKNWLIKARSLNNK